MTPKVRSDAGTYFTNTRRRVEVREVRQMVERARAENPEAGVVIVADEGSRIGRVAAVMDQVEVIDFTIAEPSLASIVRQIYAGSLTELD